MMSDKNKNSNWTETEEGYVKNDQSSTRGTSPFDKPIPPVRDSSGRPLVPGGGGKVDWNRWAEEIEKKRGKP